MPVTTLHDTVENTYFDRQFGMRATKILPGEYHVVTDDALLVTVLGSCVSACIRDPRLGVGGMNHFMLPENGNGTKEPLSESARYGAYAMEVLVNQLMKQGARRDCLEAKVFGGGSVMAGLTHANVGERNAAFVLEYLRAEGIAIAARDLLDVHPRKVYFFPRTGRVLVKKLYRLHNDTIIQRERVYRQQLRINHVEGEVELFG